MQQCSIYLRGDHSSCLVKVPDVGNSVLNADLARDLAQELGIYPEGTAVLAYSVVEQDESFYNKLILETEITDEMRAKAR